MPKYITDKEKEMIKDSLVQSGIQLIRDKGLRRVTVDDLTQAAGIAKGTFYSYYSTKEELLFEIVMNSESKILNTMLNVGFTDETFREVAVRALFEIYLAHDSIVLYIQPGDLEYLMRKLPDKVELKANKAMDNLKATATVLNLDDSNPQTLSTLAYLMDALHFLATNKANYGEESRQESLKILVNTIAEFMQDRRISRD